MRNVGFIFQLQWQLLQLIKARNITHFLKSNGIFSKNVNQFFIYAFNKIISEVCVNNVIFKYFHGGGSLLCILLHSASQMQHQISKLILLSRVTHLAEEVM